MLTSSPRSRLMLSWCRQVLIGHPRGSEKFSATGSYFKEDNLDLLPSAFLTATLQMKYLRIMKTIFLLLFASTFGLAFGQFIPQPMGYNPDGNSDGLISVSDLQDLLALYGLPFAVEDTLTTVVFPDLQWHTDGMEQYGLSNAYYYSLHDSVDVLVHPLDIVSNGIGLQPIIFSANRDKPLLIFGAEDITHHIDQGFVSITFRSEYQDPYLYPYEGGIPAYGMLNNGVIGPTYPQSAHLLFKKFGRWYIK